MTTGSDVLASAPEILSDGPQAPRPPLPTGDEKPTLET